MVTNNASNNKTGASGKVLQGQGVGVASDFSTATYPSTATGTGKILRADGTNWVATTATYPDTASTSGNVLTSDGTNWVSSAPSELSLGYNTGQFYNMTICTITATSAQSIVADTIKCCPFVVTQANTFDQFAFSVTTQSANGTSCRLGIYNSVNGMPGTVLATLGTVLTDTLGTATVSVSRALNPGYYWVALQTEATVSISLTSTAVKGHLMPLGTAFSISNGSSLTYTSQAYGSGLPNLTGVTPGSFGLGAVIIQMRSA